MNGAEHQRPFAPYFAGAIAAVAGIVVGAIWDYFVTMLLTWGRPRR